MRNVLQPVKRRVHQMIHALKQSSGLAAPGKSETAGQTFCVGLRKHDISRFVSCSVWHLISNQ